MTSNAQQLEQQYHQHVTEPRYERIYGVEYNLASPLEKHQELVGWIYRTISEYLDDKPCKVYVSPYDLYFNKDDEEDVIQPDVFVICNPKQIRDGKAYGAPKLVIEVYSKSTGNYDLTDKKFLYEDLGVEEYLIVRDCHRVYQYLLNDDGIFTETIYYSKNNDIQVPLKTLEGLTIVLGEFIHSWN